MGLAHFGSRRSRLGEKLKKSCLSEYSHVGSLNRGFDDKKRIKVVPSQSDHHKCTLNGKIIEKNEFLAANFLYEPIFDLKNFVHWDYDARGLLCRS